MINLGFPKPPAFTELPTIQIPKPPAFTELPTIQIYDIPQIFQFSEFPNSEGLKK